MSYLGSAPAESPLNANAIPDGLITTNKISNDAVTGQKILENTVTTREVGIQTLFANNLANASVTTFRIANANITSSLLAPLENLKENLSVAAAAFDDPTNCDLLDNSVFFNANAADTNFTVNFRGDANNELNDIMSTGNSISAAVIVTNTGSAYYINGVKVDGSSVTPKVQGGSAISAGNANSTDVYLFTIIKTGNDAFTILESQSQFA